MSRKSTHVPRVALAAVALAASLTFPAFASAATPVNVTLDPSIRLMNKVGLVAHVSFTCDPVLVYDWMTGQYVLDTDPALYDLSVTVTQAAGKSVATATGNVGYGASATCDSTTVNSFDVQAVATTVPFRTGPAVASATVQIGDGAMIAEQGTTGLVSVRLASR